MAGLTGGDLYEGAAGGWERGAELVYQPLAHALVARSPIPLAGRQVLDVGAGTGAGTRALRAVGARPVALDLSFDMLGHRRAERPPAIVADVLHLPIRDHAAAAVLAPFVLNHVDQPVAALRELARSIEPGGAVLASTFSESDRPAVKGLVDEVATRHGWTPPEQYTWMKTAAMPLLGTADRMIAAAAASGLVEVDVFAGAVDVGVSSVADAVAYRLGMAQMARFLAGLAPPERDRLVAEAEAAVAADPDGGHLAPHVVFLVARVPDA